MNRSHESSRTTPNDAQRDRDHEERRAEEERWRQHAYRPEYAPYEPEGLRGYEHAAGGRRFETPSERFERSRREMGTTGLPSTYGNVPYETRAPQPWRGRDEYHDFWGQERHPEEVHPTLWSRVKGVFTGHGPKNYVRSDERIREDVCEHLADHPYVDASEIEVFVTNGEVTLTGVVDARMVKRAAEECAEHVRGVKDIHNQLRVKTPQTTAR